MEDAEVVKMFSDKKSDIPKASSSSFRFSLKNRIGGLARALRVFQVSLESIVKIFKLILST